MGEGASSALGEPGSNSELVSAGMCPPGFRLRLSWSFLAEMLSEGKRSDFFTGLKAPSLLCQSVRFTPTLFPFFAVSFCPSRLSALEELIRRQLWLLSLVTTLFLAFSLGVFPSCGVERSRGTKH